jgi:nucleotide-binding universal stress UspA family protein
VYDHTAWAAKRIGAKVHVLHMLDPHREQVLDADFSGAIGLDAQKRLSEDLVALEQTRGRVAQARGRAILATAARHLADAGLTDVTTEQRHGSLIDAIDEQAHTAGLVVIGKRGEAADFAKLHLGANLERVIRGCPHPVLVASRAFKPVERFALAYDGSPSVLRALDFIIGNPLLHGLRCQIVRAGKIDDDARYYLGEAAGRLRDAGFEVDTHAVPGAPEEVIGKAVRDHHVDLLVMGAYGHSRIRQFIVGSTTTALVRTCLVPVLMFR